MALPWAMKNKQPIYAVYDPPLRGFPYLAVVLATDGTVTAIPFDTIEEASTFNNQLAKAQHGARIRH
ncbi:hypothetical protein [Mesorhizobium sp. AR10]|uniref:hypothetical protein n=1 Tax=Mesorhizobium sp. AR10 TaxID=2865839 RepID=UPI00215F3C22|nr:hypothetical protein [Mesorhizobium sp. AR10]